MTRIERSIEISAPPHMVWSVVADLGTVADWNPNVRSATCSPTSTGVGATRICALAPRGRIKEVVSKWTEGREVWFAIGTHGGIRSADMGLVVRPDGETTIVDAVADYHLALGPVGPVIDTLTTKRLMNRMLEGSLNGLKRHVEQERKVNT
jgi:carbon monoxide dehydrogenase subunit G